MEAERSKRKSMVSWRSSTYSLTNGRPTRAVTFQSTARGSSPSTYSRISWISIPEPRQIVIKPFDMSALDEIGKAILKSDLGISPENDGKVVRLNMPPLSGDQRKKYAARAKELGEEGRVALRNIRRDANKEADALTKSGDITEDDNRDLHGAIQDLLKELEGKVSEVTDKKTTEILEV